MRRMRAALLTTVAILALVGGWVALGFVALPSIVRRTSAMTV
jgi:hypothetical protein